MPWPLLWTFAIFRSENILRLVFPFYFGFELIANDEIKNRKNSCAMEDTSSRCLILH